MKLVKNEKTCSSTKTNESNNCWSRLNASRAVQNTFVGRMFVTPDLKCDPSCARLQILYVSLARLSHLILVISKIIQNNTVELASRSCSTLKVCNHTFLVMTVLV